MAGISPDLILKILCKSENYEARASEIASKLHRSHYAPLNPQISRFSKRVIARTGVRPPLREDGTTRWWHVPFLGYDKGGRSPWILRPELATAFENVFGQDDSEIIYAGEMTVKNVPVLSEGTVSQVFVNHYERNKSARNKCIAHHGSRCVVCGFDFEKVYGLMGKNKIHVHHLVPLSKIKKQYKVDPVRDLRPVCPNCHQIIHSKKEPFTIEEVREMIDTSGTGR
ncbi:MAG: 5-methylcytosine-specific restriction enzyme [Methanofollis sp.]|nr:5-methylcytosine-specific restriction enzyme [Methanofollis sp.]